MQLNLFRNGASQGLLLREHLLKCLPCPHLECQPHDSLPFVNSPMHLNTVISSLSQQNFPGS
jgi:hypothetical protein